MRFKVFLLFALFPLLMSAMVYPAMRSGNYVFRILPVPLEAIDVDGTLLSPPPASIGVVSQSTGQLVPGGCMNVGDFTQVHEIVVSVSATGNREAFAAHAYSGISCTGLISGPSENIGLTYPGMSPHRPNFLPPEVPQP